MPRTNGYSTGSPMRCANARNSSGPRSWSRKNTTRWSSHARRMAATVSSVRSRARSTPWISAPSASPRGTTSSAVPVSFTQTVYTITHRGHQPSHQRRHLEAVEPLRVETEHLRLIGLGERLDAVADLADDAEARVDVWVVRRPHEGVG